MDLAFISHVPVILLVMKGRLRSKRCDENLMLQRFSRPELVQAAMKFTDVISSLWGVG